MESSSNDATNKEILQYLKSIESRISKIESVEDIIKQLRQIIPS